MSEQTEKRLRMIKVAMIMSGKYDTGTVLTVDGVNEFAEPIREQIPQLDTAKLEKDFAEVVQLLAL